jgi:hypothetical protein
MLRLPLLRVLVAVELRHRAVSSATSARYSGEAMTPDDLDKMLAAAWKGDHTTIQERMNAYFQIAEANRALHLAAPALLRLWRAALDISRDVTPDACVKLDEALRELEALR